MKQLKQNTKISAAAKLKKIKKISEAAKMKIIKKQIIKSRKNKQKNFKMSMINNRNKLKYKLNN